MVQYLPRVSEGVLFTSENIGMFSLIVKHSNVTMGGSVISVWSVYTVTMGGGGTCNQCMECVYSNYGGSVISVWSVYTVTMEGTCNQCM